MAAEALSRLYGHLGEARLKSILSAIENRLQNAAMARPDALRRLDAQCTAHGGVSLRDHSAIYCAYIDKFCGRIDQVTSHADYLSSLGVDLFHPLPLLKPRDGENDGGFAVADFRDTDPRLGTLDDLKAMASGLREAGIGLILDVVCNHTADQHPWARGWINGDPAYSDFYIKIEDAREVADWEVGLTDIFPETAPGSFTYVPEAGGHVWTSFYPYQWDLNYQNPEVFIEMLDVLLFLSNAGAEGFRLDSAPFLWKQKGTGCRGLAGTHDIVLAWKCLVSLVAPSVFFLAEAIESLDDVLPFFGADADHIECDMAYNNVQMTAVWASLAESDSDMFHQALARANSAPKHATWLNYVRCHDDIIWSALGDMADHDRQKYWSNFYSGSGYADGMAFQAPAGGAPSTCGMALSLCGAGRDPHALERLKLVYGLILGLPGVPMIYMGDEIGLQNDRRFLEDPDRCGELRWLHRPDMVWGDAYPMFEHVKRLLSVRQHADLQDSQEARPLSGLNKSLVGYVRVSNSGRFICLGNLTNHPLPVPEGLAGIDLIEGSRIPEGWQIPAYGLVWLWIAC